MKYSLKATSIIESMIVLLVVVTGITGVFGILTSSQKLANSTSTRIEAIQIARDGLESFTSIRNTNWILYGADYENCWNVLNYDGSCIGVSGVTYDIKHDVNQGFKIYRDTENKFRLELGTYSTGDDYGDSSYRNTFQVEKDSIKGFYTQSGGTIYGVGTTPFYTREIKIEYLDENGNPVLPIASLESDYSRMKVYSIVQWNDTSKQEPQRLEMSTLLTNWKAKK